MSCAEARRKGRVLGRNDNAIGVLFWGGTARGHEAR